MLRLQILRHAKSSWAEAGQKDFDRGLDERGSGDLPRIANAMRERGYMVDHVLCSPSRRTRMTLHGIMLAHDNPPTIDYIDALYSGTAAVYLDCVRRHAKPERLMIVGHNPTCAELASLLAGSGDAAKMAELAGKFPTGALAVLDFAADDWAAIGPGQGQLVDFIVPRMLA